MKIFIHSTISFIIPNKFRVYTAEKRTINIFIATMIKMWNHKPDVLHVIRVKLVTLHFTSQCVMIQT